MTSNDDSVVPVSVPQVNVNDLEVTLVGWWVEDGGPTVADEPLYEVETSKSVGDVPSPATGILRHTAKAGDVVGIGEVVGYIGPSAQAIDRFIASLPASTATADIKDTKPSCPSAHATIGAIELARRYSVDLAKVPAKGKVRRPDVQQFIADHGLTERGRIGASKNITTPTNASGSLPPALAELVEEQDELSDHQWAIAQHLARTQDGLVVAHASMDVSMQAPLHWIDAKRQAGMMAGPIPILLRAAACAIQAEPRLASFRIGRRVYHYSSVDLAFTARGCDGRLFTPVVRNTDRQTLDELAAECSRLGMAAFRGNITAADLSGGCLTVSVLSDHPVRSHIGLQNAYQSAILTAGAIRKELVLRDDRPVAIPTMTLTLSYDHGLMDGWQAAESLATIKTKIETLNV